VGEQITVGQTGTRRRVAVVTGAATGIGRASALRLAADGFAIAAADRDERGAAVVAEIVAGGGAASFLATDVTDPAAVGALAAHALERHGRIDALVAAAGVLGEDRPLAELPLAEWRRVLAINLDGVLHCCQAMLPVMLAQGAGRIVAISSAARFGSPGRAQYGVSKAALVSLITALAHEYARAGVLANCVEPGRALTDMVVPRFDAAHLADPPGVAIGRYSEPEEVAEVVAFLCSERNTYAVGAVWGVTGGVQHV
jgi:2-dehydro-3-deoxy-L-rhamnonate dehydrogenase (NAD+)